MIKKTLLFVLLIALSSTCFANTKLVVKESFFAFSLPTGWEILNQDEDSDFYHYVFYSKKQKPDVIQFSVSKWLNPLRFLDAKSNLRSTLDGGAPQEGWKRVSHTIVEIPPLGEVDQIIEETLQKDMTTINYIVYGNGHIALIEIILDRHEPEIVKISRPLLANFKWL